MRTRKSHNQSTASSPPAANINGRNTTNARHDRLRRAPEPPVIGGALVGGDEIGFLDFLTDSDCETYCAVVLGGQGVTAAGTMLAEFRRATEIYYYGHRRGKPGRPRPLNPGKLTESNAATKKGLKKFARIAYRGDPDRRGVLFWERVAWLLWESYASLMALRVRAEKIKQQEIKRIANLPTKRVGRAAYMRRYRANQRAKAACYVREEDKSRWRERRTKPTTSSECPIAPN